MLDSYFSKGLKIIRKKEEGSPPWFLLTGISEKGNSLINDINLPVFHCSGLNSISQKIRTIRWWFFRDLSVLELSGKIYDSPGLLSSVKVFYYHENVKNNHLMDLFLSFLLISYLNMIIHI